LRVPKKCVLAMVCATFLQALNMMTVRYNNAVYIMVMVALLGLAGWEVKK